MEFPTDLQAAIEAEPKAQEHYCYALAFRSHHMKTAASAFSDAHLRIGSACDRLVSHRFGGGAYQRREPERTLLYRIVRENLASFLAEAAQRYPSGELPHFIACEFERYLRCGLLCHGFARLRCPTCRDELLVAFSCKNRGVCPSCSARRTADTAAHLRDLVLPDVPVRQFVMTTPKRLRFVLAFWPKLISLALNLWSLFSWQRRGA